MTTRADIHDQALATVRAEHVTHAGELGWGCSCGAGRGLGLVTMRRARAAADAHLRSEVRKALGALADPASSEVAAAFDAMSNGGAE